MARITDSFFAWLEQASPGVQLNCLISGGYIAQSIRVVADLGIADLIASGQTSSSALAEATGSHSRSLYRVLRTLASVGIFSEQEPGHFSLTPMAELLRSDSPTSLRGRARQAGSPAQWRAWGELGYSVKTGKTAFEHVHGMDVWEYHAKNPAAGATFNAAMTSMSLQVAGAVSDAYDFSGVGTVVDVAGGHGALLMSILGAHPHLRGILTDLPHVADGAERAVTEAGLGDRCTVVAGDMFEGVPAAGDLYLLSYIIHDWDNARSIAILERCRQAVKPGGKVLLIEDVIKPGDQPSFAKLGDLQMLVAAGGQERTEDEYRALAEAAGLTLTRVIRTRVSRSIVELAPVLARAENSKLGHGYTRSPV